MGTHGPEVKAALVEGTIAAPILRHVFELTTAAEELPEQLYDLASNLRSRIAGLKPDSVLVRRADLPPRASNREGPRERLLVEGALVMAAREDVRRTYLLNGRDAAARAGLTKPKLDALAKHLDGTATLAVVAAIGAGIAAL